MVLEPHVSVHALWMGHDLSVAPPHASRMERPRALRRQPSVDIVGFSVLCVVGSLVVHHPLRLRILSGCVATWKTYHGRELLCELCQRLCYRSLLYRRKDLLPWPLVGLRNEGEFGYWEEILR